MRDKGITNGNGEDANQKDAYSPAALAIAAAGMGLASSLSS